MPSVNYVKRSTATALFSPTKIKFCPLHVLLFIVEKIIKKGQAFLSIPLIFVYLNITCNLLDGIFSVAW